MKSFLRPHPNGKNRPERRASVRPRGVTLLEVTVCAMLVAVLLGLVAEMTVTLRLKTAEMRQRDAALLHLENILEEATMLSWEDVSRERIERLDSWQAVAERWPSAATTIEVTEETGPAAKRIAMQIDLAPRRAARPVRLAGWLYFDARNE